MKQIELTGQRAYGDNYGIAQFYHNFQILCVLLLL